MPDSFRLQWVPDTRPLTPWARFPFRTSLLYLVQQTCEGGHFPHRLRVKSPWFADNEPRAAALRLTATAATARPAPASLFPLVSPRARTVSPLLSAGLRRHKAMRRCVQAP